MTKKDDAKSFLEGFLEGFGLVIGVALVGFFLTIPFWR